MGIAALASIALPKTGRGEFRVLPAGNFKAVDGRPVGGMWVMNAAIGAKLVGEANARKIDYVIDYEHQTLNSAINGQPAPAAGWFKNLVWRDDGLYVTDARWTGKAAAMLDAGEYRFISPTLIFDEKTFEVIGLAGLSLVNLPALHELPDLSALKSEPSASAPGAASVDMTPRQRQHFKATFGFDVEAGGAIEDAKQVSHVAPALSSRESDALGAMLNWKP